jgi:hypothetical protein
MKTHERTSVQRSEEPHIICTAGINSTPPSLLVFIAHTYTTPPGRIRYRLLPEHAVASQAVF